MASKLLNKKENSRLDQIKRLPKTKIILILTAILVITLIFNNYRSRNSVSVEIEEAQLREIKESINASGEINARSRTDLNFLTSGEVTEITIEEGDFVEKGQLLARLDTTNLYQSYLQAEANLRAAEATLQRVYDDVQGSETDESFSEIETRTNAEAAKDVAYRSFVQASQNLANGTLRAPKDGIVAFISEGLAPGFFATPATAEIIIVDPETIIFEADVSEVSISNVYIDQNVELTLDAYPDEDYKGKVVSIGVTAVTTSTGGTAYPVQVSLDGNIGDKFKLGMNGDAEFIKEKQNDALTIPITALVEEDDKDFVWISENGQTKKKEIKTGIESINYVEVTEGISEGQIVIIRPPSDIEEGKRIIEQGDD